MPRLPPDWDPETPGSRFTSRAGFAILTRRGGRSIYAGDADSVQVEDVVNDALGAGPSMFQELGRGRAIEGSYGRGAAGLTAVVEWTLQAAATGVIGAAAWEGFKRGAARLRALADDLGRADVQFLVSRGAAALLAIDHVLRWGEEDGILDVEAVEEPSALAGHESVELGYVGAEPWLVSLVNEGRTVRYVVVVQPDGRIVDALRLPISDLEATYLALPPRE